MRNFQDPSAETVTADTVAETIAMDLQDLVDTEDGFEFPDSDGGAIDAAVEVGDVTNASFLIETAGGQTFRVMVVEVVKANIDLEPASGKRACCGALFIQGHRPDCFG
jgi:hypothetical protein